MNPFKTIFLACVLATAPLACLTTGCNTTQQKQAVNSLWTVGAGVDATYRSYLDLVVTGKLATNSVPKVSQSYGLFQTAFKSGIEFVAGNTNAAPPQSVLDAAANFSSTVDAAKKGKPLL